MTRLTRYFVNNTFLVNLITVVAVLVGTLSFLAIKKGLIPPWIRHQIQIEASIDGASPSQVEEFITFPIEQNIRDLSGIEDIRSDSFQGFSRIRVNLESSFRDVARLEQEIKDKLAILSPYLPESTRNINVRYLKSSEAWFSSYALLGFSEQNDTHQRWLRGLKQRLSRIEGINRVYSSNNSKQIYVKLNKDKLARYQIPINEVQRKIRDSFRLYPVGRIDKGSDQYLVEILNKELRAEDVKNIVIRASNSRPAIRLSDIAEVDKRVRDREFFWFVNGQKNTELTIFNTHNTDLLKLKDNVAAFFEAEKADIPAGIEFVTTGDGPAFLERQIDALKSNSLFGLVLVLIVLFFFLGWRNSLMTTIGLPLCYGVTFTVLHMLDIKLDLMTIVGMLLVLGILVDDAIIVAEQYAQKLEEGHPPKDAAVLAVKQMWMPILGATMTTIVAFLPMMFGNESSIIIAIPIVIITALSISLFECFFVLPNHLAHFVKKAPEKKKDLNIYFQNQFSKILSKLIKWRYVFIAFFTVFMGYSIYFAHKNIPMDFNLNISNEKITIHAILKESKSLQDSREQLKIIDEALAKLPKSHYSHFENRVGKIWLNGREKKGPRFNYFGVVFAQRDPNLNENKDIIEVKLKEMLPELKKSGIFETLDVQRKMQGANEARTDLIEVSVESYQPFSFSKVSEELKAKIEGLKGVKRIDNENTELIEAWQFSPAYQQVLSHGLTISSLSSQLRGIVDKDRTYEYKASSQILNIYTYTEEESEQSFEDLQNKQIILGNGTMAKLSDLGTWKRVKKFKKISHNNLMRKVDIDIPFDKDIIKKEILIEQIKEQIKTTQANWPNLIIKVQDADEQSRKSKKSMSTKFLFAIVSIFFILSLILRSVVQPFLICMAIPFGVIGIIWAFHFHDLPISLMAIIGMIGMAGVVVNDSLILVNSINLLKRQG